MKQIFFRFLLTTALLTIATGLRAAGEAWVSGRVTDGATGQPVPFATVLLKGTSFAVGADAEGRYQLQAPAGAYTLTVRVVGYRTAEAAVRLESGRRRRVDVRLSAAADRGLGEVVVSADRVSRVKQTAYNVVAVDTRALKNTTKTLSEALAQLPGLKLRESGGVGSDMQMSLDGFTGKHVKVFIDGVPQEGVGQAFSLNNIPVGFAERIEVYKGVVPVGFGTDALGGVINVVTAKRRPGWFADASYSYGSFNTHRSHVNAGQTLKNGLTWEVNAFQNYSDNDYYVDTPVEDFATGAINRRKTERVRRFHDMYHNESVGAKLGVTGKRWADRFLLGLTWAGFHKDIQTGVLQTVVFGAKFREGHSLMPSLEWSKRDLGVKGLDVQLTANYNLGLTHNVDTARTRWNWRGETKQGTGRGEQAYQNAEFTSENWNTTFTANYRLGRRHTLTLNNVFAHFTRHAPTDASSTASVSSLFDKRTAKNITGLAYRLMPSRQWNATVFAKYYWTRSEGATAADEKESTYVPAEGSTSVPGWGAAGTWFPLATFGHDRRTADDLQLKLSYERAYRLPSDTELFGDEDLERGNVGLRPERSDNYNLNLSYLWRPARKHRLYVEAGLVLRDTKDYILRSTDRYSGNKYYASYNNWGHVVTKGVNLSARWSWGKWLSVGGTFNYMDARDYERYESLETGLKPSLTYKVHIPNQPYLYANSDVAFTWHGLGGEGNVLSLTYDNAYVHRFPLYWENISARGKEEVPSQLAHNLALTYSLGGGRYNFTLECRNLTDERLYDNFSLQKPGRAFYGKVRIYFGR